MKATLFGATGKTGHYLIEEGLARGIELTVFVRSTTTFDHAGVRIVKGELTDEVAFREAIRGADVVLSALGPTSPRHPAGLPIARATQAIITAMEKEKVNRLIAISTGTAPDPEDGPDIYIWLPAIFIKALMRTSYDDIQALPRVIRQSKLDWTLVRVAVLKSKPATGGLIVGTYGQTKHSLTVSRGDVAEFMFDQIESRDFIRQAPGISGR